jgi:hypothetical protein
MHAQNPPFFLPAIVPALFDLSSEFAPVHFRFVLAFSPGAASVVSGFLSGFSGTLS